MRSFLLCVAIFASGMATQPVEGKNLTKEEQDSLFRHKIDSIVIARQWTFHPITIENVELGSTYDVYSYKLFFRLDDTQAVMHLPMEFTSLVIYTDDIVSTIDNYSAVALDTNLRRIAFTMPYNKDEWVVEMLISNRTSEAILAITTDKGIMRYLGSIVPITPPK